MIRRIAHCRICSNTKLLPVVDLGRIALTGVFPKKKTTPVPRWPLEVVRCAGKSCCGLVQLAHTYPRDMLFGNNYGYRSGLNPVIRDHLSSIAANITKRVSLERGDIVCDIGSNDGTLLNAYKGAGIVRIGIDPTAGKFAQFYAPGIVRINDFFDHRRLCRTIRENKVKVFTTISIFYDLDDPLAFMKDIAALLSADGIWVLEQSYLPSMLAQNAFDNICHEHAAYYGLGQLSWLAEAAGLKIIDAELTELNGGSLKATFAHKRSTHRPAEKRIAAILGKENKLRLDRAAIYTQFVKNIKKVRRQVKAFFTAAKKKQKVIAGYGASTKGNVLLQVCGLSAVDLAFIMDINPDKRGCYTPGSRIPIVDEDRAARTKADHLFVLPWHFKRYFLRKEKGFLAKGGSIIFPLPEFKIVKK